MWEVVAIGKSRRKLTENTKLIFDHHLSNGLFDQVKLMLATAKNHSLHLKIQRIMTFVKFILKYKTVYIMTMFSIVKTKIII